jgi:uncharacterized protein YggE
VTVGEARTLLSVRGEAQRTVAPDGVAISCAVSATEGTKRAAAAAASEALGHLLADLTALGGRVLSVDTPREPLTWSTQSISTYEEHALDKETGVHGPTGRHTATAHVVVILREFDLLGPVEAALTSDDPVGIDLVRWLVDDDNPDWALVRADAIRAALIKGQDYASALGGSVIGVEHVADAGLLGNDPTGQRREPASALSFAGGAPEGASLDPVPQQLSAVIEARLTAIVGPLPAR